MTRLLSLLPLLTFIPLASCLPVTAAAERPNILYIYVDDMGWGSIGPNGQWDRAKAGQPHLLTPNLDRVARAGVNFPFSYGCTVCSPARSSQQTGFHQGHTYADRNDPDNAKKAIRAEDATMGDVLKAAGYTTGYWGKWGYGGSKDMQAPTIDNVQTLPTSHGYQHVVAELHHVRAHTFFQPTLWSAPVPKGAKAHAGGLYLTPNSMQPWSGNEHPNQPALQGHKDYPKVAYCDDVYAFAALDFVRREAQSNAPFFGLLAFQVPHAPFGEIEQLPNWDKAYRDASFFDALPNQAKQWAAMISRIDGHIGNLLAALDDPNGDGDTSDSVRDNTLIIFQSDNGGPQQISNKIFDANGGLSGGKGSVQEGGIRVPTLMAWPAHIKPGGPLEPNTNCDRLIDVTDLLPTFAELAGAPAPLGVDGVSLAPTLTGKGWQSERAFVIHESGRGDSVIMANGDKYLRSKQKKGKGGNSASAIYNVRNDPGESKAIKDPEKLARFEQILRDEHAGTPAGQCATYHNWIAKNGGAFADADNWSEYKYANAGITYQEEAGGPKPSWIIQIEGERPKAIMVDADASVLALGMKDGTALSVTAKLTVRNELRIGLGSVVGLREGGEIQARQIEIQSGGMLAGDSQVNGTIYNHGSILPKDMKVNGSVHFGPTSVLYPGSKALEASGRIELNGELKVGPDSTDGAVILKSDEGVTGTFSHKIVRNPEGQEFEIQYEKNQVVLKAK